MLMPKWFYKLIKMIISMCLAKLSEIERVFFSKIIIWSGKLSDINVLHFYNFDLNYSFIHKNMSLNYVFGYVIFHLLKLKLKKNVFVKQTKPNV